MEKETSRVVPWRPWSAVLITLAIFLISQLIALWAVVHFAIYFGFSRHLSHNMLSDWLQNSIAAQFFYVLLAESATITFLWLFINWRHGEWKVLGFKSFRLKDIIYALTGLGIYFICYLLAVLVIGALWHGLNVNQSQDVGFNNPHGSLQLLMAFASLVILPPIVEETIFRGFLFTSLRQSLSLTWTVLITSLLFALPHLLEAGSGGLLWIAGIDTFILSIVLCLLREKTSRLYAGMLVHAIKNFVAFASLYLIHVH